MRGVVVIILIFGPFVAAKGQSDTIVPPPAPMEFVDLGTVIKLVELVRPLIQGTTESKTDPIRINKVSGRLYRKYNKQLRKGHITPEQYKSLTGNLNKLLSQ